MNKSIQKIVDHLRLEGKDYTNYRLLLDYVNKSEIPLNKDDFRDFLEHDFKLQVHTTSNELSELISSFTKKKGFKSAIDFCCGTGNILIHLKENIGNLTGIEINTNVAALTSYFIPDIEVINANTFLYNFTQKYDFVVGNIPWAMPVEFNGKKMRSEEAFIRKAFEICSDNGEIIIIVPYSFLYGDLHKKVRREFRGNLKSVIGLPEGIMNFSSIKTAILHFTLQKSDSIDFGIVESLDDLGKSFKEYIVNKVKIENIHERLDPEFYQEEDLPLFEESKILTRQALNKLSDIINGAYIPSNEIVDEGDFLYLTPRHIQNNSIDATRAKKYVSKKSVPERFIKCIAQPGDIVISTIFNELKLYVIKHDDPPVIVSNSMTIIRSINDDYIVSFLNTEEGKKNFTVQADRIRKGVTIPHISIKDIGNIQIPILPFSELNNLGNKSISNSKPEDLESLLELLKELKGEVRLLKEENISIKSFLDDRQKQIMMELKKINQKVDTVIEMLADLSSDFKKIKDLPRSEDEKILQLYDKIDNKLDSVLSKQENTIETYIKIIKNWLHNWELLDDDSKRFLPSAEYIFDKFNEIGNIDYSPFVIQYCRSLENEILKKLFITYHEEGLKDIMIDEFVNPELEHLKTGKFAHKIKHNITNYTLGEMSFIVSMLKEKGNTLKESKILQHFRKFSLEYFEKQLFQKEFLCDLEDIRDNYRNKAAHPNVIDLSTAQNCQILLRKNLNYFLDNKK